MAQRNSFVRGRVLQALDAIGLAAYIAVMANLNAAIKFDGKWFVARCLDLPVSSQGRTLDEAKANLTEAVELYIETWGADDLENSVGEPELAKLEVAV